MRGLVTRQEAKALGIDGADHQEHHTLIELLLQLEGKFRLESAALALSWLIAHLCVENVRGERAPRGR